MEAQPDKLTLGNDAHGRPAKLSPAFLLNWLGCRYRAKCKHILRLPDPSSLYGGNGGAAHAAVAALHQSRIDGTPMLWPAVNLVYEDKFYQGLSTWKVGQWDNPEKIRERTTAGLDLYYHEHAAAIQPLAVEEWLEAELVVDLPDGRKLYVPWVGRADLVDRLYRIVDFKLVLQTPEWERLNEAAEFQVLNYALARELTTGEMAPEGRYDYLIVPSRGKPQVIPLAVQITPAKLQRFTALACQVATEIFYDMAAINPTHQYCTPTGCPYWKRCHDEW